jgi:hypothetical protein
MAGARRRREGRGGNIGIINRNKNNKWDGIETGGKEMRRSR